MQHVPAAVIVDISHNVAQYDLQQAAYLIRTACRHFSAGTIHRLQVDASVGNAPRVLLAEKDGSLLLRPTMVDRRLRLKPMLIKHGCVLN